MKLRLEDVSYRGKTKVALVDENNFRVWEIWVIGDGRNIKVRNNDFAIAIHPDVTNTIEIHERP